MSENIMLVTLQLGVIVAQKIGEDDGIRIRTRHPAFITEREDQTGFDFKPLKYVKEEFTFCAAGLLGYTHIPKIWEEDYTRYIQSRE